METIQDLCAQIAARVTEGEHQLATANEYARILQQRNAHLEIELAQARDALNHQKDKYTALREALEAEGITVGGDANG